MTNRLDPVAGTTCILASSLGRLFTGGLARSRYAAHGAASLIGHTLISGLTWILNLARELTRGLFRVFSRVGIDINGLTAAIACIVVLFREIVASLARYIARGRFARRRAGRVVPSADRIVRLAALMLPSSTRPRFSAEFWSELWEIAGSGGRFRQLMYALRQLRLSLSLRRELRAAQHRKALP
jgi:hypothetical protein